MRRLLDLALWVVLLAAPALVVLGGPRHEGHARIERAFQSFVLSDEAPDAPQLVTGPATSLGRAWFLFFFDLRARLGLPQWCNRPLSVGIAWLLFGAAFALLVGGAVGPLATAVGLLLMLVHPELRGLGALMTPWLPAFAFVMLGLAFLQGMVLPTIVLRRSHPGRWVPRLLSILGCGIAFGLASSAEERIGWLMLVPSFLLMLSVAAVALTLWRVRNAIPPSGLLFNPWAILRRTLPWGAAWFFVFVLFVRLHEELGMNTEGLSAMVEPAGTFERVLAWSALPGILWLGYREGQRLGFRSQLGGSTVLFVCLFSVWLMGPALVAEANPLERLLGVPVFAASIASWVRWRG